MAWSKVELLTQFSGPPRRHSPNATTHRILADVSRQAGQMNSPAIRVEGAALQVRVLHEIPELASVDQLFVEVWGRGVPVLGAELLRAISHAGGYVSGAYLGDRLVGASAAFLGRHGSQLALHSHATGVSPAARGLQVGRALKLHQRHWARAQGIEVITWTFDPLVRRNAWFNLALLGARPAEYLVDFYGPMSDAINAGDESDRLLVAWEVRGSGAGESEVADRTAPEEEGLIRIPTPPDIESMRHADPAAARQWRHRLRADLHDHVQEHRVVGFAREGDYLVRPRP